MNKVCDFLKLKIIFSKFSHIRGDGARVLQVCSLFSGNTLRATIVLRHATTRLEMGTVTSWQNLSLAYRIKGGGTWFTAFEMGTHLHMPKSLADMSNTKRRRNLVLPR
jgi:hypothetical protein